MTSVLFISRTGNGVGGMQTYTAVLHQALQAKDGLHVSACIHHGYALTFPLFLVRAFFAIVVFRGDVILLADAALSPLALLKPRRTAVITHGLDVTRDIPGYRLIVGWCLRSARTVVAVSRATGELVRKLGVDAGRLRVISCPLPVLSSVHTNRNPSQILFLGRLVPRKGVIWFVESVLPMLASTFPHLHIVVAGTGPDASLVTQVLGASPFRNHVSVVGYVTEEEKARLLASSALLIVPNVPRAHDPEGFGIVCIEAGAAGLPVVAARIDGLPDAVSEGVTGFLFEPESPSDCVRAVSQAFSFAWNPEELRRTVQEKFSSAHIVERFVHDVF